MDYKQINEGINALLENDSVHQELLDRVNALEPDYLRILSQLPKADQELLSDYIAACEELDYHRIYPAYRLGVFHGTRG